MSSYQTLFNGTTADAAGTNVLGTAKGIGRFHSMNVYASLIGATGGTLDIYLQYSPDGGTTWVDYAHFAQLASGASAVKKVFSVSKQGQQTTITTVGSGTNPALAADTVIGGDWGDMIQAVAVSGSSTSAGAAIEILLTLSP